MMNIEEKLAELEALLFIHGEPIRRSKIQSLIQIDKKECEELLAEFVRRLKNGDRGLTLTTNEDEIQLVTKAQFGTLLKKFMKEELSEELSPASLEALSIVAYLGPMTRSQLEYIRGVNSTFILRSLLIRGFIERYPDSKQAQSYLYRPSINFLKFLGLERQENLPEYEKFRSLLSYTESQNG